MDTSYHFRLSPIDLYWLARTFGIPCLPLPEDPLENKSLSQLDEILKTAPSTLQARGLIRKASGAGWEIDRLPAAIAQWLGQTNSYVTVSMHQRNSSSRLMNVFLAGNQGMTILLSGDSYNIDIFPTTELLVHELLSWFGVTSISTAQSKSVFNVSKPMEYVPGVWADPIASAKTRKSAGKNNQTLQKTLEWIHKLNWIGKAGVVSIQPTDNIKINNLYLCGDGKTTWIGLMKQDNPDFINLSLADNKQTVQAFAELIMEVKIFSFSSSPNMIGERSRE